MSAITTHVLDTSLGRPASDMGVRLEVLEPDGLWKPVAARVTNGDGRVADLLSPGQLEARTYRLIFETGAYQRSRGQSGFYPRVEISFEITEPGGHYHVPLLLSPFGYSTYRGS
jgi:5-hydroxyisourate hydrolase